MNQDALLTPFLRHQGHAVPNSPGRIRYLQLPALKQHLSARFPVCAENRLTEFGLARAHQSGNPNHLAALYLDGDILYLTAGPGQIPGFKQHFPDFTGLLWEILLKGTAQHLFNDFFCGCPRRNRRGVNHLSIAHDRVIPADFQDFI